MRVFGLFLLLTGFTWLCLLQVEALMRPGLHRVVRAQYAMLSPDPDGRYPEDVVHERIRATAVAAHGMRPGPLLPGVLMLVGGVVLLPRGPVRQPVPANDAVRPPSDEDGASRA